MRIMVISRPADEKFMAILKGADEKQRLSRGVLARSRVTTRGDDEKQGKSV